MLTALDVASGERAPAFSLHLFLLGFGCFFRRLLRCLLRWLLSHTYLLTRLPISESLWLAPPSFPIDFAYIASSFYPLMTRGWMLGERIVCHF